MPRLMHWIYAWQRKRWDKQQHRNQAATVGSMLRLK